MSHTHTMICTCCGAQTTVTNDTLCEADPFPFTDGDGRICEYNLLRTPSGRLRIERVDCEPWLDPACVGVESRSVDDADVLVNGSPRPGWHTTKIDWAKKQRGTRYLIDGSNLILSHVKLELDGQVTTMTGTEYYDWLERTYPQSRA